MLQHAVIGERRGALLVERERAMDFLEGYTQATGVQERERQELLGKVMDLHKVQFLR